MKLLLTADWHLTARPADAYRWRVLETTERLARREAVDAIGILGDLTHFKDHHPSRLIAQLVEGLVKLAEVAPIVIIAGNHDYEDARYPLLSFLGSEMHPRIQFFAKPERRLLLGWETVLLPHQAHWRKTTMGLDLKADLVLCHQCFTGAATQSGVTLSGASTCRLGEATLVFAGDIHAPQQVGPVTYVGAPHPINFGDTYPTRMILVESKRKRDLRWRSLPIDSVSKAILRVSSPDEVDASLYGEDDQLKVVLELDRVDAHRADALRQEVLAALKPAGCRVASFELDFGVDRVSKAAPEGVILLSPEEVLRTYAKARSLSEGQIATGLSILRGGGVE